MTVKTNKCLWLRIPQAEQQTCAGRFLPVILALIATVATTLALGERMGLAAVCSPMVMLLSGCGACVVLGVLMLLKKQKWFYPAMLVLLLLTALLFEKQLTNGFALIWNRIGDVWLLNTGWVLPEMEVAQEGTELSGALVTGAAGAVLAVICCALAGSSIPVLTVLLPGALLAAMIAFRESAAVAYLPAVLISAILFLLYSGGITGKKSLRGIFGRILPVLLVGAVLLTVVAVPGVRRWAEEGSRTRQKNAHRQKYETEYTTLPEGDFTDYSQTAADSYPALVVNMEIPQQMYLRGFTGAVFDGSRWTPLEHSAAAENKELLYWLNLNAFNPNAQYEKAVFVPDLSRNTVTVQNIGACSQYLYVPYNLCLSDQLQAQDLSTGGVAADGSRIYTFSTVGGDPEDMGAVLAQLQTTEEGPALQYRKAESAYRTYARENYLQIPQGIMDLLKPYWDQAASGSDDPQECVRVFLQACFGEEGSLEPELPLAVAEDSSYQYATVAVMTLRYFGIPARYAEGYVISRSMAEKAAGESIEVGSGNAGAWAEVYQDGIGWIPMALTPSLEKTPQGIGNIIDPNGKGGKQPPKEGMELEEPETPLEEPQPEGGYMVSLPKTVLWGGVTVLAALIALAVALLIRHSLKIKGKNRRFDTEDPKEAVAWIFADAALLLEAMGLCRGNGSVFQLEGPVRQRFGDGYAEAFIAAARLNARALFSSREMTQEERTDTREFHKTTVQQLRSCKKWYQRLWMRWILCLY